MKSGTTQPTDGNASINSELPPPTPESLVNNSSAAPDSTLSPTKKDKKEKRMKNIHVDDTDTGNRIYAKNTGVWHDQWEAVVGLSHRNIHPPFPCQDSAFSRSTPHPLLIVADGAGSSPVSEIGSFAVTTGLARLLNTLDKAVSYILDKESVIVPIDAFVQHCVYSIVDHAHGILVDLSSKHRRPIKDFRCTLLLILVGNAHSLWIKVGDGALVTEKISLQKDGSLQSTLETLGTSGKGEYANETTFIDENLRLDTIQYGLLDTASVCGFAVMSDGAAERLVSTDGKRVGDRLATWLDLLRHRNLHRRNLTKFFYSEEFCKGHMGDDCSIALLAGELLVPHGTKSAANQQS